MTQRRLKVIFLTSSYPRAAEDTASVFLRYLAEHLSAHEIDVHVVAPADRKSSKTVEHPVTVHRFQYFPASMQCLAYGSGIMPNLKRAPWLWCQVPFFLIAMARSLCRLIAKERFDVIHAHWILPAGFAGWIGSRLFGVPLVVSVHGTDAFTLRGSWNTALKRRIIRNSAAWTANTSSTAKALPHSTVAAPRIIPMGVDVAHFSSGDRSSLRAEISAREFLLLFVGRLIESKGCDDLLRALAKTEPELRATMKLWIIGDGDQRPELERMASNLLLAENVRFFGAVTQQRLPDLYAAADLVVIPSKNSSVGETEGQSVVVLEAFAARCCVLATRIGGIPSMIEEGVTGMLVEPANPVMMADAIASLVQRPDLCATLAENAFARLQDRYSWTHVAGDFAHLYREITDARNRSVPHRKGSSS